MMACRGVVLLLAGGLLAGCALTTPPTQTEVLADALPSSTTILPAWQAEAEAGPVADDWLKSFDDPVLEALVAEALANNLDLRQAAENVRIAQQGLVVVGSRLKPQVGAVLGGRVTWDDENDDTSAATIATAGVSWEIDVWGRLRSQRAAAEEGYEATALDFAFARQSLAATVAKGWYLAIESRQLVELAEQTVAVFSKMLELVSARRTGGKDSDLNVADTEAKLQTAQSDLAAARQTFEEACRALEVLLGRYPASDIEVAAVYPPLPPPAAAGVPASLLERRPDLVAAERAVIAAFRQKEAARLALLPDFSFSFEGGRLGDQILSVLGLAPWLASAAVGAAIPIFDGGALRAQVEITTAQEAQAVANYGAAALTAFREVENAIANERSLVERLEWQQQALESRIDAVRIATIQFKNGRKDLLWVSALQSEQLATEASVLKLTASQRVNRIQLHLALGGSFDAVPAAAAAANL
jgi:multidrug efflux system outer membrane protein